MVGWVQPVKSIESDIDFCARIYICYTLGLLTMKYKLFKHAISIAVLLIVMLLLMFLPFVPGKYDRLAVSLSYMTQVFSYSALLFFPLGLWWLFIGLTGKSAKFGLIQKLSLMMAGVVGISMALAVAVQDNYLLGVFIIITISYFIVKGYRNVNVNSATVQTSTIPISLYMTIIPVVLFVTRSIFIARAAEYSRKLAIENSATIIQDIENYYQWENQYPVSLQALHGDSDYPTGVIGIQQYFYERNGNAYNIYFEHMSTKFDMEEVVMFNKFDEHQFAAHTKDILEFTGEELALRRGDRRKFKLPAPHWVYFEFD